MTRLEPGQRDAGRTRKRWFFLALAVGSALAVLVVGTLFGVLGEGDSAPTVVHPTVHATASPAAAPVVGAPAVSGPPVVPAPPAASGDGQTREVTTKRPDGTTTTVIVSSDGTVRNTTTRAPPPN